MKQGARIKINSDGYAYSMNMEGRSPARAKRPRKNSALIVLIIKHEFN